MADLSTRKDLVDDASPTETSPKEAPVIDSVPASADSPTPGPDKAEPTDKAEPDQTESDAETLSPSEPEGTADVAGSAEGVSAAAMSAAAATYAVKAPKKARPRPPALVLALAGLLVVLLVAGVGLFVYDHQVTSADAERAVAVDTARQVATNLTTITSDSAAGQIDALSKASTGSFKDQIVDYSAIFQAVVKQGNVASRGTITAAGIEKLAGDSASALVTVSALLTSGQVPQGLPRSYRLLISLQRNGNDWLVSNVDFVS
ncbi:MAG: hypothetical protein M3Z25_11545 [Actinomycetota bacterium]|nr:hypothetical protein [Actinomycetota bacterium]